MLACQGRAWVTLLANIQTNVNVTEMVSAGARLSVLRSRSTDVDCNVNAAEGCCKSLEMERYSMKQSKTGHGNSAKELPYAVTFALNGVTGKKKVHLHEDWSLGMIV